MIEILVNDVAVDLPESGVDIGIDYAIFDINNIGNRAGVRSYAVELPYTNRNKAIFESADIITNLGTLPYSKIKARILVNGVDVKIKFCTLKSIKKNFNVEFYGGNSDVFADLKERNCHDLDLSDLDHFWTLDSVSDSRHNTEGYIYPVIDWHLDSPNAYIGDTNHTARIDFFLAALYFNTALERIFAATDYTLVNTIAEETEKIIVAGSAFERNKLVDRYNSSYIHSGGDISLNNVTPFIATVHPIFNTVLTGSNYFSQAIPNNRQATGGSNTNPGWLFANHIKVRLTYSFSLTNTEATAKTTTVTLGIGAQSSVQVITIPAGGTQVFSDTLFADTDEAIPRAFVNFTMPPATTFIYKDGATAELSEAEYVSGSVDEYVFTPTEAKTFDYITPSTALPDIPQSDLVKAYLQMFGLLPVINEFDSTITLIEFDRILSNVSKAYDWSSKIDLTEPAELTFIIDKYGRKNNFKYADEDGETKPQGTDGAIEIANDNLVAEVNIVELPFAATNTVTRLVGNTINQIGVFEEGEFKGNKLPRVLVIDLKDSTGLGWSMNYDNGLGTVFAFNDNIPFTYFIQDGKELNLGFGNNLLSKYYELIEGILNNSKLLTIPIRLNASDINQIDFTIPVYLSQYESYFYINKVHAYRPETTDSSIVELVKLNL